MLHFQSQAVVVDLLEGDTGVRIVTVGLDHVNTFVDANTRFSPQGRLVELPLFCEGGCRCRLIFKFSHGSITFEVLIDPEYDPGSMEIPEARRA